jgi:hypothetical protein
MFSYTPLSIKNNFVFSYYEDRLKENSFLNEVDVAMLTLKYHYELVHWFPSG